MRKIGIASLLLLVAGCTSTGNGSVNTANSPISPVLFDRPSGSLAPTSNPPVIYTDQNEKPLDTNDIRAINEAISAGKPRDWAPQEEVMQQQMNEEI